MDNRASKPLWRQLGYESLEEQTEYVSGALAFLETMCQKKISNQADLQMWVRRMGKYPKWRIAKLSEYTGYLSNDVFAYLDGLSREIQPPKYEHVKSDATLSSQSKLYIDKLLHHDWSNDDERWTWELSELKKLSDRWPTVWMNVYNSRASEIEVKRKEGYGKNTLQCVRLRVM